MSGPAAPASTPARRPTRTRIAGCALAVLCGLAAVPAQEPPADNRSPLPAEQTIPARYQVPNSDRGIFARIEDDSPLLSEARNWEEYAAYTEVVQHAKQFTAAELERVASRDFVREDLVHVVSRNYARVALMRFDGRVTKVRKVRLTRALAEAWLAEQSEALAGVGLTVSPDALGATGVRVMYQAWMVPAGEPDTRPVCLMVTDLPPGVEVAAPLNEYVAVDRYAAFAGYSFKLLAYPGPQGDPANPKAGGWLRAPLLVGVSFTPTPEPPPAVPLNKGLRVFSKIADDRPMAVVTAAEDNWEELEAWNTVVLHARRLSPEQLGAAANKNVGFGDLFKQGRLDYKLDVIHFEGRLVRLRELPATEKLRESGVATCYEGWLIPRNEPAGNPVCVVLTELPEGLEPQPVGSGLMNKQVAFDGYSFKLMHYTSADPNEKAKTKAAPLLIGRTLRLLGEPPESPYGWNKFVPLILGGLLGLVGLALGLSWWFRRGDRAAKTEIDAVRHRNPFEG
ncbi:MAG: hypothetical protein K2P78_09040 [Gemmataceae bacterium]|nr:hypothetical protein [Gemmataceae bacterium]